ncbi:ribonuclease R [Lichenihabitans sp. Uapishka_5]|nr:ribonuclease R [Lichenihabitans sp. Uapishka_5]MDX7952182.1 ribonuclease R [Lichenihabitans sp. Uapishka_5]
MARNAAEAKDLGRKPAVLGKREIARAFGVKGADRSELKRMLRELEREGTVTKRRKHLRPSGAMPPVIVAEITSRDRDGELVAVPNDWDTAELGAAPRILIEVPRKPKPGAPVPGVGNRVLIRIAPAPDPDDTHAIGRVVKILTKSRARMLGVFHDRGDVGPRVSPVDKKAAAQEWGVAPEGDGGAQDGDLVAVEPIGRGTGYGLQLVRVVERLGTLNTEKAISRIAIETHDIPAIFRPDTLAEAEAVVAPGLAGREDWRALPLVTIDPPDAKDHDDAVHAVPDTAEDNPGGFVVSVAIADVASLVRPGTALDREALVRGNSVYFPDGVVPMLPERISTDLGSLRADVDRPALAVRLVLGADGRKRRHSFHRILMRSHAKLAYAQAQAAIDGQPDATTAPLLEPVLRPLWAAYRATTQAKAERGPLDLDLPERKILLTPEGTVDRVIVPQRLDAHRLIEEFMILANVAAAEALEAKGQPLIYRVHDEPTLEKLRALSEFLATIGIKLAKGQTLRPAQFNGILARVKDTEHEHLVNEVVLRSQAQAEYAADNYGHFGLNLRRYAHFTSPIRRYADLVVHRALIRALDLGSDGLADMTAGQLAEVATRISAAERRAMAAERETVDRLIATFLADRVGAIFSGRISGVTKSGLFVKLDETGADGFIPASTLGDEYFRFEEARRAMVGTRTATVFRLGDTVEVKLVEAAPFAGALRFAVVGGKTRRGPRGTGQDRPGKTTAPPKSTGERKSRRRA